MDVTTRALSAAGPNGGRKGSVIKEQYERGQRVPKDGEPISTYPTNEEVAKAVQQKVAAAVEMSRKYRHVAWYSLFVAAYMVVLYLQASAYRSGEVVETLKAAFIPPDVVGNKMTFKSEDDVLNYIGNQILQPIWKDPICGDGTCDWPWEFPAWGSFGCLADCGPNPNTTQILINVKADFSGHPTIAPTVLMANANWNLCLTDDQRRSRGEPDLCWFSQDQPFTQVVVNSLSSMAVIDGLWYIIVKGDYAGRVQGTIYDISNASNLKPLTTDPAWVQCQLPPASAVSSSQTAVRRLLQAYTMAQEAGPEDGRRIVMAALDEIQNMEGLRSVDFRAAKKLLRAEGSRRA